MKQTIVKYLQIIFPFLITIALWRLSSPWINPAGILAIIPIFYCSFIRPVPYFTVFAILLCFLIDYKFDTVMFWTSLYCAYYAIMNIQTIIDLTHTKKYGIYAFMIFFGIASISMIIWNFNLIGILGGIFMFIITCAAYIPVAFLTKVVCDD
ncbi:MAG: hypothetical protein J5742_02355 [Alphaproteobacteria bacterium]|nr:hypothetical protein [Alphaproteobacteria bacterium]